MKMFYTQNELKNLTADQLLELTTFGNSDNIFYYNDVETVSLYEGEMRILFKNKEELFTDSEETFENIKNASEEELSKIVSACVAKRLKQ